MKRWIAVIGGVAVVTVLVGGPASAASSDEDAKLQELWSLREDGDTATADEYSEFVNEVEAEAAVEGVDIGAFLDESIKAANAAAAAAAEDFEPDSSGGCSTVIVNDAEHVADVFYSPASRAGITYGHSGIFSDMHTVVEAPGTGKVSRSALAANLHVCVMTRKMEIVVGGTSTLVSLAKRQAAGDKAYNDYRGLPYDNDFAINKENGSSKVNCSELVWRAYKMSTVADIDLDGDGGPAVYPVDIRDDNNTVIYDTRS